ncbi:hypothetical protein MTO96_023725 [Rhipicephalus appendiculatus]
MLDVNIGNRSLRPCHTELADMSLLLLLLAAIFVFAVVLVVTYLTYRRLYDNLQFKPKVLNDSPVHVKIAPRSPSSGNVPSITISHSLPEMKEVIADGAQDVAAKKRQLSHRLDLSTTVPFEVCNMQQRESHGTVGAIQPELYDQEGLNSGESGRDSTDMAAQATTCGKLHFTLKYDIDLEGLVVKILQAKDLPSKDFLGSSDPYIKLYLLPERRKKFQTRVHRKNLNPVFNESFVFAMTLEELRQRTLQFSVYDFDRFLEKRPHRSRDRQAPARVVQSHPRDGVHHGHCRVCPSHCHQGQKPEAHGHQRVLRPLHQSDSSSAKARESRKKKTSVKKSTLNPVFNEALVFDVPPENVDDVNLAIKVVDYDRVGPNELMGCCAVGQLATGVGRDHWLAVMDNPRKPTAQWYPLVDSLPAELDPPRTPSVTCLK